VRIIPQGEYVATSLKDYLLRHPEIEQLCSKNATCHYLTTESPEAFRKRAHLFLHEEVDDVENVSLE
jgi:glutamate racemase